MLCFTETWFCDNISDDSVAIDGFGSPFRCDRDCDVTGKKRGGGVTLTERQWATGKKRYECK